MSWQSLLKKAETFNSKLHEDFNFLFKSQKEHSQNFIDILETIKDMQNQIDTLKNEFEQYKQDNVKWKL